MDTRRSRLDKNQFTPEIKQGRGAVTRGGPKAAEEHQPFQHLRNKERTRRLQGGAGSKIRTPESYWGTKKEEEEKKAGKKRKEKE